MLTREELLTLVRRIVARMQPDKIVLFGSYAKGTATLRSDVDLLVVKETTLPIDRRADAVRPLLRAMIVPIDLHVYTPEEVSEYARAEFNFLNSALRSGETLYERHSNSC